MSCILIPAETLCGLCVARCILTRGVPTLAAVVTLHTYRGLVDSTLAPRSSTYLLQEVLRQESTLFVVTATPLPPSRPARAAIFTSQFFFSLLGALFAGPSSAKKVSISSLRGCRSGALQPLDPYIRTRECVHTYVQGRTGGGRTKEHSTAPSRATLPACPACLVSNVVVPTLLQVLAPCFSPHSLAPLWHLQRWKNARLQCRPTGAVKSRRKAHGKTKEGGSADS